MSLCTMYLFIHMIPEYGDFLILMRVIIFFHVQVISFNTPLVVLKKLFATDLSNFFTQWDWIVY
jgi:hypothetical protein